MRCSGFLTSRNFSGQILNQSSSIQHINAKIKDLIQRSQYAEALESYSKESIFPMHTPKFTFPSLLKSCTALSNLRYGETLQSAIIKLGLQFDPYISTSLINMYVKCGSICPALELFDNLSQEEAVPQDVALWNSVINGLVKMGFLEKGVVQFHRMQELNVRPDGYTLCILLGAFGLQSGKEIHGYILRNAYEDDAFLITAMTDMYSRSCRPGDAWNVFRSSDSKFNIAIWNSMMNGFCENELWIYAVELYAKAKTEGIELVSTTLSSALKACSQCEYIDCGRLIHCDAIKLGLESDPYISTSLLTFYSNCGFVHHAERVFFSSVDKKVEMWNCLISAYVKCDCAYDALNIYQRMRFESVQPDLFTISNTLVACSAVKMSDFGRMIHAELIKSHMKDNVSAQSALLTMYSKLGTFKDAQQVFMEITQKDLVAWGSMISGSSEHGYFFEALDLYKAMESDGVKPDSSVIASVMIACTGLNNMKLGYCIHGSSIKKGLSLDSFTGSSLIEFYSKCGHPEMAKNAFLNVVQKNLVVWNSLISSYSQNSLPDTAISLLPQILLHGLQPDSISITTSLVAVSNMAALVKGKMIHCYHLKLQISNDVQVENALMGMYIKCGCFMYAEHIFQNMSKRNTISWNIMIAGYGSHGECLKAIELFNEMRKLATKPDEITFLSLLSSCNHCGFVEKGLKLFESMSEHGIEPKMSHYVNMVDLLGRAGRLHAAYDFIQKMTIEPDRSIWLSLLSASRVHRNVELGEVAVDKLTRMDSIRGCDYVQILNLYTEAGLQEKAAKLRGVMREKGLTKTPGCSWIEVKNKVDVFFSGDCSSFRTVDIYETLRSIRSIMKRTEYYDEAVEIFNA